MSFLADKIMANNLKAFAGNKSDIIPCIMVVEEAQNVLNPQIKEEGRDVFIRIAKEGRIYITQQPGSIDGSILSQTDNFFVMHLLNEDDIKVLQKANFHYSGCIANFLKNEAIVGNVYIYSAPYQPYIFPAKVYDFETISESNSRAPKPTTKPLIKNITEHVRTIIDKIKNTNGSKYIHEGEINGSRVKYIKIGSLQNTTTAFILP